MKQNLTTKPAIDAYNAAVTKAYFRTLDFAKEIIARQPSYEARCSLELEEKHTFSDLRKHQFVSPLFYLSLEVNAEIEDKLYIHFGYEQFDTDSELADLSSKFVRALYRFTSKPCAKTDIEDCISCNNIITTCSELFEAINDSGHKRHIFKEIPFRFPELKKSWSAKVA